MAKFDRWLDEVTGKTKKKSGAFTRKPTELDKNILAKIRKQFNAGWNKNVAFTKGKIGNDIIDIKSRSGKPKGTNKNWDDFKTIPQENYHYKDDIIYRPFDAERKQIEYLYNKYKNNKNISGKIEIVSDKKICGNCEYVIDKFAMDFPNIEVIKVWVRKDLTR